MDKSRSIDDQEIDLIKMFLMLWKNKFVLFIFMLIGILCGLAFNLIKDSNYISKINIQVINTPPSLNNDKNRVFYEFKTKFFTKKVFEEWKNKSLDKKLDYDMFSGTIILNGIKLTKQTKSLISIDEKGFVIVVNTNDTSIINSFYNYLTHINKLVTSKYILNTKQQLTIIKSKMNGLSAGNSDFSVKRFLDNNNFIDNIENGSEILSIKYPTIPEEVFPNSIVVIIFGFVISSIIGLLFVLIRNFINQLKY